MDIKTEFFSKPRVGEAYEITEQKEVSIKTDDGMKPALRVAMKSLNADDKVNYSTTLWLSDNSSMTSKLGAFTTVLGTKSENWIGKRIRIVSWSVRNREIVEVS